MKVQPIASNAIEIILGDGTTYKIHDTFFGNKSYLFFNKIDNAPITIESMNKMGLQWYPISNKDFSLIRIS
jgi:hypothetical protein